jgi:cytoskeletal protein CcmA (bactofilin family)
MERPSEIGPSIVITGEITAREELVISGRVEGAVRVDGHAVTVASGARVKADVEARQVIVAGAVTGSIQAVERVELRESAEVEGTIEAPALKMIDGATFRGAAETKRAEKSNLQLAS